MIPFFCPIRCGRIAAAALTDAVAHTAAGLGILVLTSSCAAFQGVDPTDLSRVAVGAERAEVERSLGEPSTEHPLACGSVAIYSFNRGRKPFRSDVDVAGVHPAAPILAGLISHPFLVAGQRGRLDVVYGPDGRVIDYVPGRQTDWQRAALENGLAPDRPPVAEQARRYREAGRAAAPGVAAWGCFCLAAHLGDGAAQLEMARAYRDGTAPVAADPVAALTWALLAARSYASGSGADPAALTATMSGEAIAAAYAAAAAWRPDTAACRRILDATPRPTAGAVLTPAQGHSAARTAVSSLTTASSACWSASRASATSCWRAHIAA